MSLLEVRPLVEDDWPWALALRVRAFTNEPFMVEMLGEDPVARYAANVEAYGHLPWSPGSHELGGFLAGTLVGAVRAEPTGCCPPCTADTPVDPADRVAVLDAEFRRSVRTAHARLGEHGWVGAVVVEPALHGAGLGRELLAAALGSLAATGTPAALLECQPHRTAFYAGAGFVEVDRVPDPVGPPAALMRALLQRPS